MKLTITTLTGEKFDVEVKAEDKVKDVKAQLYRAGRFTSVMRLLHTQAPMEDDRKLCEYSLPEGAIISALFEPDVNINIDVSTHHKTQKLTVSNTMSVTALKLQIPGVMRCGVAPERLEIKLGDVTLEDQLPLHFYGMKEGSKLEIVKPFIEVIVENQHGKKIYWRLKRKNAIKDVKVKLASDNSEYPQDCTTNTERLRLYLVPDPSNFIELDDEESVDNCGIQDGNQLFLLTYRWTSGKDVTIKRNGRDLQGVEPNDTHLVLKLKAQDKFGLSVGAIKLARLVVEQCEHPRLFPNTKYNKVRKFKQLKEIGDEESPFKYKQPLYVVTEEDLQDYRARVEEEELKAWQEEVPISVKNNGGLVQGVKPNDTCLAIKLKAQDQFGLPAGTTKVARLAEFERRESHPMKQFFNLPHDYLRKFKQLTEINDEESPFKYKQPLYVVTEEELQADRARREEELKAWQAKVPITVKKNGRFVQGVEPNDTCLAIKLKAQDQFGLPAGTTKVARLAEFERRESHPMKQFFNLPHDYLRKFKQLTEINDEESPFKYKQPLYVVTEEELQADRVRVKEEEKAWREEAHKEARGDWGK